ncbi:hypothetical protein [Micromonospora sp. NBC_01813]|uniref:hypothetical protein n=1 Tax=Micromonospora sp. NBC_01813 TaxID=2975988 RepID=UPI002DD8F186|nr:hypothetical protein [Micromonospora sp. NBC_01813]WSA07155.1 hypothetical protein OG958_23230 [Micromonospora sp. NBC_01813]
MGTTINNPGDQVRDPTLPILPTPPTNPDDKDKKPPPEISPDSVTVTDDFTISYEPGESTQTSEPATDNGESTEHSHLSVSLSSLAATEAALLTTTRDLTDKYEQLRTRVLSERETVFGQNETHDEIVQDNPGAPHQQYYIKRDVPDILHEKANEFAGLIRPSMAQALDDFAKTMQLFGAYVQALEATGDGYATADDHSRFDSG